MSQVYSSILLLHEEPKDCYQVCSLFRHILSSKSFWKERHEREGLPFTEHLNPMQAYYLAREFVKKDMILSCHLSELPFFPSSVQGEEYYPRAIKFKREKIHKNMNAILAKICSFMTPEGEICYDYKTQKSFIDRAITVCETLAGTKDPDHPSLDASVMFYKTCNEDTSEYVQPYTYDFYIYINFLDDRGERVEIPIEDTLLSAEQALSIYLQLEVHVSV
jgi:hypothetical protein